MALARRRCVWLVATRRRPQVAAVQWDGRRAQVATASLRRLRLVAGVEWRGPGRRLAAGGDVNRRQSPGRLHMDAGSGGWVVGRPREGLHRKLARRWATTCFPGSSTDFCAFVDFEDAVGGTKHEQGSCHGLRIASERSEPRSTDALPCVWLRRLSCRHGEKHRGRGVTCKRGRAEKKLESKL